MSSAEALYDRRDFLTFAHKKSKHPNRQSHPGKTGSNSSSPQPGWGGTRPTRRQFIIGGAVAVAGAATGIIKPWEWFAQDNSQPAITPITPDSTPTPSITPTAPETASIAPELERLGQELKLWSLQDGRKMTDLFTEVLLTADLLQGNLDPKTILPQFKPPLRFSTDVNIGGANITENIDSKDPRKVGIYTNGKLLYYSNWLAKDMSVKLQLGPKILSSEARWYIIVKEASQLIYRQQYLKLYIDLLTRGNTVFEIANPTNIPISEVEKIANIGMTIANFERQRYGYSSLDDFIDVGTRLQTAPLGATQRVDRERRNQPFDNPFWSQIEQDDTKHLIDEGLLREDNGVFAWAKPFVVDEDFFALFSDYVKSSGRPALILPQN